MADGAKTLNSAPQRCNRNQQLSMNNFETFQVKLRAAESCIVSSLLITHHTFRTASSSPGLPLSWPSPCGKPGFPNAPLALLWRGSLKRVSPQCSSNQNRRRNCRTPSRRDTSEAPRCWRCSFYTPPMNPIKLSQMACLDTTFICWNINHINLVPALKGRNLCQPKCSSVASVGTGGQSVTVQLSSCARTHFEPSIDWIMPLSITQGVQLSSSSQERDSNSEPFWQRHHSLGLSTARRMLLLSVHQTALLGEEENCTCRAAEGDGERADS